MAAHSFCYISIVLKLNNEKEVRKYDCILTTGL